MKTPYPQFEKQEDILPGLQKIVQLRKQEDLQDYANQVNVYVSGRTTRRVPSASNDVIKGDRIGDTTNDDTYLYLLVNTTGGPLWNRILLDVSW